MEAIKINDLCNHFESLSGRIPGQFAKILKRQKVAFESEAADCKKISADKVPEPLSQALILGCLGVESQGGGECRVVRLHKISETGAYGIGANRATSGVTD